MIKALRAAAYKYTAYNDLKNIYYERFLALGSLVDEDLAHHWQVEQVRARARWSTLFARFLRGYDQDDNSFLDLACISAAPGGVQLEYCMWVARHKGTS